MKKTFSILFFSLLLFASCAEEKIIEGKKYEPYGLFNEDVMKNDSIVYELSAGSVIAIIIFCETIIVPVYTIGWDLYEPVRKK